MPVKVGLRLADGYHTVQAIDMRTASGVKRIFKALSATVDQSSVSASLYSRGQPTITTPAVLVTPVGGVGPYTYSWTNPTDPAFTAYTPANPYTSFLHPSVGPGDIYSVVFVCTVQDATGSTATVSVTATVSNTYQSFA